MPANYTCKNVIKEPCSSCGTFLLLSLIAQQWVFADFYKEIVHTPYTLNITDIQEL